MATRLSVCPPVCFCLSQVGRIDLVFGMVAFICQSYTVLAYKKVGIYKNKGTSLWNFFHNSRLIKFGHETCYQLSWRKVDAQCMIN